LQDFQKISGGTQPSVECVMDVFPQQHSGHRPGLEVHHSPSCSLEVKNTYMLSWCNQRKLPLLTAKNFVTDVRRHQLLNFKHQQ
jgi:NADPH-dependent 7-cyano-7-deazaguanine reductase QueF-like protein